MVFVCVCEIERKKKAEREVIVNIELEKIEISKKIRARMEKTSFFWVFRSYCVCMVICVPVSQNRVHCTEMKSTIQHAYFGLFLMFLEATKHYLPVDYGVLFDYSLHITNVTQVLTITYVSTIHILISL